MLLLLLSWLPSFDIAERRLLPYMRAGLLLRLLALLMLELVLLLAFTGPSASSFLNGIRIGEFSITLSLFLEPYGRPGGRDTGGGGDRCTILEYVFLLAKALSRCLAVGAIKPELRRDAGSLLEGFASLGVFEGGQVAMS